MIKAAGLDSSEYEVNILNYDTPSYTGFVYPTEKYYQVWVLDEEHALARASVETYEKLFGEKPFVDKWTFSTNGIATMGMHNVPTIGFGPANEIYAHSADDQIPVDHLVKAAALYAAFPKVFMATK